MGALKVWDGTSWVTVSAGLGIPPGGAVNQLPRKNSATDYDVAWASATVDSSGNVVGRTLAVTQGESAAGPTATTGAIRLPSNAGIYARNVANTSNFPVLVSGGDEHTYLQAGSSSRVVLQGPAGVWITTGNVVFAEGIHVSLGTTTGTKIGSSNTQKLGFWNATPVVQNTGWSATAGYSALRSFNPATATLAEVARVLGTLVDTLKTYGLLGP